MQDESFFSLGRLDGAEVGVRSAAGGQDILTQQSDIGQTLACLLGRQSASRSHSG